MLRGQLTHLDCLIDNGYPFLQLLKLPLKFLGVTDAEVARFLSDGPYYLGRPHLPHEHLLLATCLRLPKNVQIRK